MATKYTAFVWPPLIFPLPVLIGGGRFALFTQGAKPPMALPLPLAARTARQGATTTQQAKAPPMALPAAASAKHTWTPAAVAFSPSPPAKVVNSYTTQDQINSFFRIQSPRPGSGS
jgi:hypothetical protein